MDAQHAAKWKNQNWKKLAEGESQFKEALRDAELILEQQHQAKRFRFDFRYRLKIQEMTKAFNKSNLQGAIVFCSGLWRI